MVNYIFFFFGGIKCLRNTRECNFIENPRKSHKFGAIYLLSIFCRLYTSCVYTRMRAIKAKNVFVFFKKKFPNHFREEFLHFHPLRRENILN